MDVHIQAVLDRVIAATACSIIGNIKNSLAAFFRQKLNVHMIGHSSTSLMFGTRK